MFSVIIPLYNKVGQIKDAVNSVLAQNNADFELIVVDDGSTDGSYDVMASFTDSRIRTVRQENGGVSVARNTGIEDSTGDYVCFLDADDVWFPNHLQALLKLITKFPDAGLYATRYRLIERDGRQMESATVDDSLLIADLFERMCSENKDFLHTNSICIPRHIFEKVGMFVVGEKTGEDSSLWLRVAAYYSVALSPEITTVYRREYSDAFIGLALNPDWSFIRIAQDILLKDPTIPYEKKLNVQKHINRYKLSLCRHFLLIGDRESARLYYKQVDWKWLSFQNRLITNVCFICPGTLMRRIYHKKYHDSFNKT